MKFYLQTFAMMGQALLLVLLCSYASFAQDLPPNSPLLNENLGVQVSTNRPGSSTPVAPPPMTEEEGRRYHPEVFNNDPQKSASEVQPPEKRSEIGERPEFDDRSKIASSGTLIGAALQTVGYYYLSHILDSIAGKGEEGRSMLFSIGMLAYIVAAMVALTTVVVTGRYLFAIWLFLGPGMFYAVLFPRTEVDHVSWVFGTEVRDQNMKEHVVADTLDPTQSGHNLEKPRIPSFFEAWVLLVDKPLRSVVKVLNSDRHQADLKLMTRMQFMGAMRTSLLDNPYLRELIHVGLLSECREKYRAAEIYLDKTYYKNKRDRAYERMIEQEQLQLSGGAAVFAANLKYYYPQMFTDVFEERSKTVAKVYQNRERRIKGYKTEERLISVDVPGGGTRGHKEETRVPIYEWVDVGEPQSKNYRKELEDFESVNLIFDQMEQAGGSISLFDDDSSSGNLEQREFQSVLESIRANRYSCEDIWQMVFIGLHVYAKGILVDPLLSRAQTMGLDEQSLTNDLAALSGFERDEIDPELDDKFSRRESEGLNQARPRIFLYRAIARRIFQNEMTQGRGSVAASLALIARRGQEVGTTINLEENELALVERFRVLSREWAERTTMMYTAASLPYIQGVMLYLLTITYPFFACLLLIPGLHGGYLLWFGLWFWIKLWDVGFALVTVVDNIFFTVMVGNSGEYNDFGVYQPELSGDLGLAIGSLSAADPTFNLSTYYNIIGTVMDSIPMVTAYLVLGSLRGGSGIIAEGIKSYAQAFGKAAWKTQIQYGVVGYRKSTLDRKVSDFNRYFSAAMKGAGRIGYQGTEIEAGKFGAGQGKVQMATARRSAMPLPGTPWSAGAPVFAKTMEVGQQIRGSLSAIGNAHQNIPTLKKFMNNRDLRLGTRRGAAYQYGGASAGFGAGMADMYSNLAQESLLDYFRLIKAWSSLDSMTSEASLYDMQMARLYDVFELPYADFEVDPNRIEFEVNLNIEKRKMALLGGVVNRGINFAVDAKNIAADRRHYRQIQASRPSAGGSSFARMLRGGSRPGPGGAPAVPQGGPRAPYKPGQANSSPYIRGNSGPINNPAPGHRIGMDGKPILSPQQRMQARREDRLIQRREQRVAAEHERVQQIEQTWQGRSKEIQNQKSAAWDQRRQRIREEREAWASKAGDRIRANNKRESDMAAYMRGDLKPK